MEEKQKSGSDHCRRHAKAFQAAPRDSQPRWPRRWNSCLDSPLDAMQKILRSRPLSIRCSYNENKSRSWYFSWQVEGQRQRDNSETREVWVRAWAACLPTCTEDFSEFLSSLMQRASHSPGILDGEWRDYVAASSTRVREQFSTLGPERWRGWGVSACKAHISGLAVGIFPTALSTCYPNQM